MQIRVTQRRCGKKEEAEKEHSLGDKRGEKRDACSAAGSGGAAGGARHYAANADLTPARLRPFRCREREGSELSFTAALPNRPA